MKKLSYLTLLFTLFVFAGCDSDNPEPDDNEDEIPVADVIITIDNVEASAWIITAVEGTTASEVTALNTENPDIKLEENVRYQFINDGGSAHPIDFRDANGTKLLAQGTIEGSLESDENILWEENEESVSFTFTSNLSDQINSYFCTLHPAMAGLINPDLISVPESDVTITIDNVESSAWIFTNIEGATNIAELNTENSSIQLETGLRYTFINNGGTNHPLDFRNNENEKLLAQGTTEGMLESDENINWVESNESVSFTLTESLNASLTSYYCSNHNSMNGSINPEASVPEPTVTITIDNVSATAWVFTTVDGAENITTLNSENADITLTVGTRYRFINDGGTGHPLGFQDATDTYLIKQDGNGSFDNDSEVQLVKDDTKVDFTLTQSLADELTTYICTFHPAMTGNIIIQ